MGEGWYSPILDKTVSSYSEGLEKGNELQITVQGRCNTKLRKMILKIIYHVS